MAGEGKDQRKCVTYTWTLENVSCCWQKNEECIRSPTFVVDSIEKNKWSLEFYPRGVKGSSDICVGLLRHKDSDGPTSIEVESELAILAADGSPLTFYEATTDSYVKGTSFGYTDFVKREDAFMINRSIFLAEDILKIRCKMWMGESVKTSEVFFARTLIGVERRCFLWDIEKFSSLEPHENKTYLIKSATKDKTFMSLNLFLACGLGCEEAIRLELTALDQMIKFSTLKVSLLDASGDAVECFQDEFWFDSTTKVSKYVLFLTKKKLIAKKDVFLPNDVLSLHCECTFSDRVVIDKVEKISYDCPAEKNNSLQNKHLASNCLDSEEKLFSSTLKDNLKSLFTDRILCDTELRTNTGTFPVHKNILSARSPVFKAMFSTDMKEKVKEYVNIEDLKDDTVRRMLLYMYAAVVEGLQWESASELYEAADKYEILTLKNKCSSFLKANLSPINACEVLLLADLHQDDDLKSFVQDFILKHDKEIINSSEWKHLMQANLKLAADTMCLKFKE